MLIPQVWWWENNHKLWGYERKRKEKVTEKSEGPQDEGGRKNYTSPSDVCITRKFKETYKDHSK